MARTHKDRRPVSPRVKDWPVPSWYTRLLRRTFRAKATQEVRHGRFDVLPIDKRCASYYW